MKLLSRVRLFATPWTVAYQASLSMGFSRQELSLPSPGDLPDPGIEPRSPTLQADTLPSESPGKNVTYKAGHREHLQGASPGPGLISTSQGLTWPIVNAQHVHGKFKFP